MSAYFSFNKFRLMFSLNRFKFRTLSVIYSGVFVAFIGYAAAASSQTNTTYVYDAQGRIVSTTDNTGANVQYQYDKVNNITSATSTAGNGGGSGGGGTGGGGTGGNSPPSCSNLTVQATSFYGFSFAYFLGTLQCSDADGGTLAITSVTQPTNGAYVSISGDYINVSNPPSGNTTFSRTVSDGQGGTTSSTVTVQN